MTGKAPRSSSTSSDALEVASFADEYLTDLTRIVSGISRRDIEEVIRTLYCAWREGRQVLVAGNGGSASTATHFAADLSRSVSVEGQPRFRAIALTDNAAWITAVTNDLGWQDVYLEQLRNLAQEGDVFVAISVHGGSGEDKAGPWSQNLVRAAAYIREHGGKVVGLIGFDGGALRQIADASVVVPAKSTPQVEGLHLVLTHLICGALHRMIASWDGSVGR